MEDVAVGRVALPGRVPELAEVSAALCERSLKKFCIEGWSNLESRPIKWNWHMDALCLHIEAFVKGIIPRLIINISPRSTKSTIASVMAPAWSWTTEPSLRWLTTSYAQDLAIRDAMKSRWLLQSPWYQERWGDRFILMYDQNEKSRYTNDQRGYRIAAATKGKMTGEGGDRLTSDDPHNMRDIHSDAERVAVLDWFDNVFMSRFEDAATGGLMVVAQRGHPKDLCGHILETERDGYTILSIPMEFDPRRAAKTKYFIDPRKKKGELMDKERFPPKYIKEMRRRMTRSDYAAQYQQDPSGDGGHILKMGWWKLWKEKEPPVCDLVFQVYDTAFEEKEEADWSARTTWGLFMMADDWGDYEEHIILLDHWEDRCEYPELRKEAKASAKVFDPDLILIEKKASGHSLLQDLRKAKPPLPVRAIKINKDKVARAHSATLMFEQGRVWHMPFDWAEVVKKHCADFPRTDHKDTVDTVTMAAVYLRLRGRIELEDEKLGIEEELEREHDEATRATRRGYA